MCIFASRQCADYARVSYVGAGEARVARVTFATVELLFDVCSIQAAMAPPSPTSISITKEHRH